MRRRFCIFLICAAVLIAGCNAGTPDAELGKSVSGGSRKVEAAGEKGTAEQAASKKEAEKKESAGAKEDTADKEKSSSKTEAAEADTDKSVEKKDQKDTAEQKTEEKAAEKKKKEGKTAEEEKKEEKTEDKKKEEKTKEKKKEGKTAEEEKKEEKTEDKKKEEKTKEKKKEEKAEEEKKEEKKKEEKKKEEKKTYGEGEQYMPDGFTPYGSYVLIYDDGYEVKTRYTAAGLTYYYESEEFFFKLNKDLPDMKREIAHILFNTTAPMDPSNTEGEEFPYDISYMIYISLDDGSYYEVSRWNLDLEGRLFVRDIFETFRQEWEGKL